MWSTSGIYSWALLFLLYINDMPQAVTCDFLLYADDTYLVFQHKDVIEIETVLNKNFSSLCDWFIDNKLSIHFGEEKTKSILLSSKHKVKKCKTIPSKHFNIGSTLFLGSYDVATSHNVKSTLKQRCVCQR